MIYGGEERRGDEEGRMAEWDGWMDGWLRGGEEGGGEEGGEETGLETETCVRTSVHEIKILRHGRKGPKEVASSMLAR